MKLLNNNLLVERVKRETALTDGGILLPPICLDDNNTSGPKEWGVIAVGPGRRNRKGIIIPIECQPGDRIICESYTTGPRDLGNGRCIITDDMILAVIPKQTK